MLTNHTVAGGGGVRLHVVETGNSRGQPILFLHGLSQCWLTWSRQLHSDLADEHRLVAMDMRGHGLSERPLNGYAESKLWADDLNATIHTLHLDHPVLVGWSYGPLVILDYIRHYGEDAIGGIDFVGGVTKLGSDEAMSVLTPEFLNLVPELFSTDAEESVRGLRSLLYLCFARAPSDDELYLMLGFCVSVPPFVRQALLSRAFDNDDLLPMIHKPVLITHGARDRVVKRSAVEQHQRGMRHAQVHVVANTGHAPFWDDAPAFNQRLREFCASAAYR
ncbi:MAG TPA: alpha/beta hydrolase [Gemmatimonadaceae bacterium]|nr:alpha/beta hydrolase [Gemmatimonadaceae bacterium]